MSHPTPPLPALRAFASFVRLGSIAAAADELSLTQGAVTHQIHALERFLDAELVQRAGRRLTLTETGRHYGYQVRQALDDLAEATQYTRKPRRGRREAQPVRVSVLPSFAQGWLLPRLPGFFKLYPHVRLVLNGSMEYADLGNGHLDCAIRFGHGNWPDAIVKPLMRDSLLLIAAPRLPGKRSPTKLQHLLQQPLLHSSENWARWLASMNEAASTLQRPAAKIEFTDSTHLLEAVRQGLGIALTRRSIADRLLRDGELIKAFDHECLHSSSYYALLPPSGRVHEATEQFIGWLQIECARYAQRWGWRAVAGT